MPLMNVAPSVVTGILNFYLRLRPASPTFARRKPELNQTIDFFRRETAGATTRVLPERKFRVRIFRAAGRLRSGPLRTSFGSNRAGASLGRAGRRAQNP